MKRIYKIYRGFEFYKNIGNGKFIYDSMTLDEDDEKYFENDEEAIAYLEKLKSNSKSNWDSRNYYNQCIVLSRYTIESEDDLEKVYDRDIEPEEVVYYPDDLEKVFEEFSDGVHWYFTKK